MSQHNQNGDHEELHALVAQRMVGLPEEKHDSALGLPLQVTPFGALEVNAMLDVLLSTWVTMGKEVAAFEEEWAQWCGTEHAVMVNSGSSANLIALATLVQTGVLVEGDEVLVPAVAWSTSLFPVAQLGLVPVLVDVCPERLGMDPVAAKAAMGPRTKAAMVVHLLGMPADIEAIEALGLIIIEDSCAAHGAQIGANKVGSMGRLGTFSFFFSHHITTVEGGMVVCSNPALLDAARSLRAHGWIREMEGREMHAAASPEIDPRFLFVSAGWNLRPTDLAGAMGRVQLMRLDPWLVRRRANHARFCERLARFDSVLDIWPEVLGTQHAGFAFPMCLKANSGRKRSDFMAHLESRKIATRPISGSNLARQPVFEQIPQARISGDLHMADSIHERGLFVGNSHAFHDGHADLLERAVEEFFDV
jgi:CDP-6-deoxy-D-xylo-4-hexulose-3-dehydrase